jgi:hypothetical protein
MEVIKMLFKNIQAAVLAGTIAMSASNARAQVVSDPRPVVAILLLALVGVVSTQVVRSITTQHVPDRVEVASTNESLKKELGDRYEEVLMAMANRQSSESISWMQQAGPVSQQAYAIYQQAEAKR